MAKGNKDARTRNWTVCIYPDSLPSDWKAQLQSKNIEYVLSPLHDADKNGDETEKKKHWHLLMLFGGVKSYNQVYDFTRFLNCPAPQKVHSVKAIVRYFIHLDHPDKHQYKQTDLECYGGVDIDEFFRANASERYDLIAEMIDYIRENNITEFTTLVDVARMHRKEDWFPLLCDSSTIFISKYIQSNRHQYAESRLKQ